MKIREKLYMDAAQLIEEGPITIVALGDSVTHGAFEFDQIDYEAVYWEQLRKKLIGIRDYVPINVINAGIGGTNAQTAVGRLERQVLDHHPDLVTVCFGLNDVNGELEEYLSALRTIFERCTEAGCDVIFMTPNMLNTYVSDDLTQYRDYAEVTAEMQNSGKMDLFMKSAVKLAEEMGVLVSDCYAKWKELANTQDTTKLLANRINHPTREMHTLFAESLFEMIAGDLETAESASTMYRKN